MTPNQHINVIKEDEDEEEKKGNESTNNITTNDLGSNDVPPSISVVSSTSQSNTSAEPSEEIEFAVNYNENLAADEESVPALVLVNGAHADGGFRVVPAEDRTNRQAEMFCILWKDSDDVECNDPKTVWLGNA